MVQATTASQEGDGLRRDISYASWRTNKPASAGYSHELISDRVDPKFYDDLLGQPNILGEGMDTLFKVYQRNVKSHGGDRFSGTREVTGTDDKGKKTYGEYQWQSYAQFDVTVQNFARGLMNLDLIPEVEGEGKMWRFLGIWAKNRAEWLCGIMACMYYNATTVGFFDAMGQQQVDFILNQTEMQTILCSGQYLGKIIEMKKANLAGFVKNLIMMDDVPGNLISEASEYDIKVYTMNQILTAGDNKPAPAFIEPNQDDSYIFSYTSGTTGDSKGVKLSHKNILCNAKASLTRLNAVPGDAVISYLPMTHSFEQIMFASSLVNRIAIGFYQGDPLKLTEDCQVLKPAFFPSVPRLYNRIYGKITSTLDAATGCKKWLVDKALASKRANLTDSGAVTHGCYDKLVFSKTAALLGGQVRVMVTGSAPIDKAVLEFLKVAFCCPFLEGYGLTESAAGSCITDPTDRLSGHVGGPTEYVKFRLKDLPEMEYRIHDKPYPRGEVCMKGPSMFTGYYKREDKTAECHDAEGWFMTGDVAMVYPNGSLRIIDRSKNIFKLSQGEYIAPEKIENIFVLSHFVGQSFVYGNSLKNNVVAIVVPDATFARDWATKNGGATDLKSVCQNADFKKELMADLLKLATQNKLSSLEKPKDIYLHDEEFTVDNNILTPTFKLKRNVANKVFEQQINEMYAKIDQAEAARSNKA